MHHDYKSIFIPNILKHSIIIDFIDCIIIFISCCILVLLSHLCAHIFHQIVDRIFQMLSRSGPTASSPSNRTDRSQTSHFEPQNTTNSDRTATSLMTIIHSAMQEIKELAKSDTFNPANAVSSQHQSNQDGVQRILSLMQLHDHSLSIQRVGCHALSNLAMSSTTAQHIVSEGGFQVIRTSLIRFDDDHQLCWLGSSAIWNLSRPPSNRSVIGKDGVDLMLQILRRYRDVEKVVNTSIGALSNLSLCHSLKGVIAKEETMDLVVSVLNEYVPRCSVSVMASGTGLINNLAVNDDFATMLVAKGAVPMLLQILKWDKSKVKETLYRNACSALNNLIDAESFIDSFLEHRALEVIRAFLDRESESDDSNPNTSSNALCANLLQNCLMEIEVDPNDRDTTSFHLCAARGNLSVLKRLIGEHPFHDLDAVDSMGMTGLDHAVRGKYWGIIVFLSKCGATKCTDIESDSDDDVDVDVDMESSLDEVKEAKFEGQRMLQEVVIANRRVLAQSLPAFPTAICHLLITFIGNVDLLKASKRFE